MLSVSNGFNRFWRIAMRPILLLFALAAIFVVGPQVGKVSEAYALEQVLATAETTSTYIARVTEEKGGTGYSLGNVSYTPQGLIVLFPRAVTVTLYQPMLYEVSNPVMLFSALESTAVLFFTIFMLFRIGLARFVSILTDNPFLLAALVFSVFFAFAVGVSTLNYGSLARYKIPCLPFYGLAVIYPYSLYRKQRKAREEERKVKTALA